MGVALPAWPGGRIYRLQSGLRGGHQVKGCLKFHLSIYDSICGGPWSEITTQKCRESQLICQKNFVDPLNLNIYIYTVMYSLWD